MIQNNQEDLLTTEGKIKLVPAPMSIRLAHFIIDSILLNILATGFNMIFHFVPSDTTLNDVLLAKNTNALFDFVKIQFLTNMLLNFIYYFPLEKISQATFGKLATNTRVISLDGKACSAGQILIRTLCRLIPFNGISFLFLNGIGWHDLISKTRVISKKQYHEILNVII
jgi:uncharacterized RDD family membrane protein YckC